MYINELLDVLFFRDIDGLRRFYAALTEKYFPNSEPYPTDAAAYAAEFDAWLLRQIPSAAEFFARLDDYSANAEPVLPGVAARNFGGMSRSGALDALSRGGSERGRALAEKYRKQTWADVHFEKYVPAVTRGGGLILELGTGAGLGTFAVMNALNQNGKLISADVDFACARNADALAAYLGLPERVCGITANFWYLPFEDGVFDTVCTHYGLDESGEIQATIAETARVLKTGGRFVAVCRAEPQDRYADYFKLWGVAPTEHREIARRARLFGGIEDLAGTSGALGLQLTRSTAISPPQSHSRVVAEFTKI
ncbi:MAG: class I SAM-dependent methyltransferase [Oscillospiraceae bacterium]|jgi:SAM-dependent methyltransferase|nr:class I SAM-dependent methyltransferase [Oscillospiraceae bacterium]